MKHLVRIHITPQAGQIIEDRPGGPHPIVARLAERFQPEALYASPARREIFMVCELAPADMAELMLAGDRLAGQRAEFTPVVEGKEFGALLGKAIPAAKKLIEG